MKDYLEARRKAIAPAVAQLAGAAVFWAVTGEINAPEISLAVSALVTALIVERTPNAEEG
jgi:hypothetical protein